MLSYEDVMGQEQAKRGIYVIQTSCKKKLWWPRKDSISHIRVYPKPLGESGFEPFRYGGGDYQFTTWIVACRVAKYVGAMRKVMFLDHIPDQDPLQPTPLDILVRTVRSRPPNCGVDWSAVPPVNDARSWVSQSTVNAFVQCAVFSHGNVNYVAEGRIQGDEVYMLPKSAKDSLDILLNQANPDFKGEPDDWANRYLNGKFLDPKDGNLLIVRETKPEQEQKDTPSALSESLFQTGGATGSMSGRSPGHAPSSPIMTYECIMGQKIGIPYNIVKKYWRPWDEVLWIMEPDKQVELLCTAFDPYMMRAAFSSTTWLPASIKTGKTITLPQQPAQQQVQQPAQQQVQPKPEEHRAAAKSEVDESLFETGENTMPMPDNGDASGAGPSGDAAETSQDLDQMTSALLDIQKRQRRI